MSFLRGSFVCFLLPFYCFALSPKIEPIKIFWKSEIAKSKTTPSLQVVVNPLLRRGSVIHDQAFAALKNLNANKVRFVPWMPYPRLGIAELNAPTATETSWDFSLVDPLVEDFMDATKGKSRIINFSTIPQWLFDTSWNVWYPDSPNEEIWNYEEGTQLVDPTLRELQNYYTRLYKWYARGAFHDELGYLHPSYHAYDIDIWEVFNEVDSEHLMTPAQYTERYDAVVGALQKVNPKMEFMSMALMRPMERSDYFDYFLNHKNHAPGIPLDWISYHFYAIAGIGESLESEEASFFAQSDTFLKSVAEIESTRKVLSPETKSAINEVGTMMTEDRNKMLREIPDEYWNLSAAVYGYLVGKLTLMGIDLVSESQLVGFPGQFPSVSMLNWKTGEANARYWALKLMIDNFGIGDSLVKTVNNNDDVFAMAFVKPNGTKQIFLVNKKQQAVDLYIPSFQKAGMEYVAPGTQDISYRQITKGKINLDPWCVAVLTLK